MARKYLIGGNWKCNGTVELAKALIKTLNESGPIADNVDVSVATLFIHIGLALDSLRKDFAVSAQSCGLNSGLGAFTSEICVK